MSDFHIDISGNWTLPTSAIWPDGDGPENPTAEDVVAVMKESAGSVGRLISDWNLHPDVFVGNVRADLY